MRNLKFTAAIIIALLPITRLAAQASTKYSSKLPKASWSRQLIFNSEIEFEIPAGFKKNNTGKPLFLPENFRKKVVNSEYFRNESSVLSAHQLMVDVPSDEIMFWNLIWSCIDVEKNVFNESGFFEVSGKTIYFVGTKSKEKDSNDFNFLLFAEHRGKLLYFNLSFPQKNGIVDETCRSLATSLRFHNPPLASLSK